MPTPSEIARRWRSRLVAASLVWAGASLFLLVWIQTRQVKSTFEVGYGSMDVERIRVGFGSPSRNPPSERRLEPHPVLFTVSWSTLHYPPSLERQVFLASIESQIGDQFPREIESAKTGQPNWEITRAGWTTLVVHAALTSTIPIIAIFYGFARHRAKVSCKCPT